MNLWRRIVHVISIAFALHSVALAQESLSDEVLIRLKPATAFPNTRGYVKSAHAAGLLSQNRAWSHLNIHHLKLAPGLSLANAIANIKTDPDVEYVEPNYIFKADQLQQFGPLGGSGFSQSSAPIKVDEAWSILTPDLPRTVVAIIDTGVDTNHEVFVGSESIWVNPNEIPGNGIDDDGNGYIDDVNGWNFVSKNNSPIDDQGHGTHVAGIVLGVTQNIFANSLEKSKILLMPLKFLDSQGSGTTSDAIDAITYAVKNGAHVLNNSWGGTGASQALLDAIKYSKSAGRSFVAAAGNESNDNDLNPIYPASYAVENIIAVAATTDSDAFADFSNFGFKTVHMSAPGQDIKSTLPGDVYGTSSGTSMATPFIAGTSALMIREKSFLDGVQVRNLILGGIDKITGLSGKVSTEGRLNVYNSVVAAQNATETSSSTLSSSNDNTIYGGAILGGGCGLVKSTSNGPHPGPSGLVALVLLLMPLFTFLALRRCCLHQNWRYFKYFLFHSKNRLLIFHRPPKYPSMKIHVNLTLVLFYIFFAAPATWSAEPFKLLTVEPAALPEKHWTVGLQQTGFSWDDFYVNTNTIMDLTMTGNLGMKYASKVNDYWSFTAGARYIHFFGESNLEDFAKKQNSMIESLKVKYNGYNAFVGTSYYWDWGAAHFNTQYASVSDSKILNLISALNIKMGPSWHTVIEAGYDFENKQPRGSLGVLRSGETFGLRLGITYVEIKDPSININLLPVLDFYWNFGDAR